MGKGRSPFAETSYRLMILSLRSLMRVSFSQFAARSAMAAASAMTAATAGADAMLKAASAAETLLIRLATGAMTATTAVMASAKRPHPGMLWRICSMTGMTFSATCLKDSVVFFVSSPTSASALAKPSARFSMDALRVAMDPEMVQRFR